MLNSFNPKSWFSRQNRKAIRRRVTIDVIERLESRDLPSASALLVDVPRWVARQDWNPAEVSQILQNISQGENSAGRHGRELRASGRWDKVLKGEWYVPAANLLAYLVPSGALNPQAIADQTVFQIPTAKHGVFSGTTTTQLVVPGLPAGPPTEYTMTGIVTRKGDIRMTFSNVQTGQPIVTGIGSMELVDRQWRMTMQMSTGVAPYVIHWAYMTKLPSGATPPPAVLPQSGESLHSGEFRWLEGTNWALTDSELFGTPTGSGGDQAGVEFQISDYRNGYFWGTSASSGGNPFTVVGTVTPQGSLFLVLTAEDGTSVTRTGVIERGARGQWAMHFRSYEGTAAVGVAWQIR